MHGETESTTPTRAAFEDFKRHFSKGRPNTEVQLLEAFRCNYPDYHVTLTRETDSDLLGFAAAGNAVSTLTVDDECLDATLDCSSKTRRPGHENMHLFTRFAQYQYDYTGESLIVFHVTYNEKYRHVHLYYILAPRTSGSVSGGRHTLTDRLVSECGHWTRQLHNEVWVFDSAFWMKNKELFKSVNNTSWDDLIIRDELKQSLMKDVLGFYDNEGLYGEYGVPWKRGIILHGVPGNGKTMCIKALMNALHGRPDPIPTLYVKSLRSCDGPEYSARTIFKLARAQAPCLLVLEDLDSLITDKVRTFFLNEVDGLENNDGILIIGSTNHLEKLDPAIAKRPSRFDRKYHFGLPSHEDRVAYSEYWRSKLARNPKIGFPREICELIAQLTKGFSFAYMKELFIAALLQVARGDDGSELPADGDLLEENDNAVDQEIEDTVVANGEVAKESDNVGEEGKKTDNKTAPNKKRDPPKLEVPPYLQDNILLKVLTQQAAVLMTEMDSTEQDEWKSSKLRRRPDEEPRHHVRHFSSFMPWNDSD